MKMVDLVIENLDEKMAKEVETFIKQKMLEKEKEKEAEKILENIKKEIESLEKLGYDLRKSGYTQWFVYADEIIITKRHF